MTKLYIRIGEIPEQELNHKFSDDLKAYSGISVFECYRELNEKNQFEYKIVLPSIESDINVFYNLQLNIELIEKGLSKVYCVKGLEVNKGLFNEPILKNVSIEFELILNSNTKQFKKLLIN